MYIYMYVDRSYSVGGGGGFLVVRVRDCCWCALESGVNRQICSCCLVFFNYSIEIGQSRESSIIRPSYDLGSVTVGTTSTTEWFWMSTRRRRRMIANASAILMVGWGRQPIRERFGDVVVVVVAVSFAFDGAIVPVAVAI